MVCRNVRNNPVPHNPKFSRPKKKGFENIVEKIENAGNQHFLLFTLSLVVMY